MKLYLSSLLALLAIAQTATATTIVYKNGATSPGGTSYNVPCSTESTPSVAPSAPSVAPSAPSTPNAADTNTTTCYNDPSLASYQPVQEEATADMIHAPDNAAYGIAFDVNVGTQGVGMSIGYEFNKYLKMRLRGAYLDLGYSGSWGDGDGEINFNGSNAGIIFDVHPFGGVFHLSAGLNFSKSTISATASTSHGINAGTYDLGGYVFDIVDDEATIEGEYSWNNLQPYLGIGWSTDGEGDSSLYFTFDIGVNFIGTGKFKITSIQGVSNVKGPNGEDLGLATEEIAEEAIREEGKDFFKIADSIIVYPVIQLGLGYRF